MRIGYLVGGRRILPSFLPYLDCGSFNAIIIRKISEILIIIISPSSAITLFFTSLFSAAGAFSISFFLI
jgi:hypothetical protein